MESIRSDEALQGGKQAVADWHDGAIGGLGISEGTKQEPLASNIPRVIPSLVTFDSAPPDMETDSKVPRKSPSAEFIEAKKRSLLPRERADAGESGDDEDEELGNVRARSKSPQARENLARSTSKLSTEMLRINSRGSVVSPSENRIPTRSRPASPPTPALTKDILIGEPPNPATLTPPEIFPKKPGDEIKDIDMDRTPTPQVPGSESLPDPDPTPKASKVIEVGQIPTTPSLPLDYDSLTDAEPTPKSFSVTKTRRLVS